MYFRENRNQRKNKQFYFHSRKTGETHLQMEHIYVNWSVCYHHSNALLTCKAGKKEMPHNFVTYFYEKYLKFLKSLKKTR